MLYIQGIIRGADMHIHPYILHVALHDVLGSTYCRKEHGKLFICSRTSLCFPSFYVLLIIIYANLDFFFPGWIGEIAHTSWNSIYFYQVRYIWCSCLSSWLLVIGISHGSGTKKWLQDTYKMLRFTNWDMSFCCFILKIVGKNHLAWIGK
jgi:hypothetical protein